MLNYSIVMRSINPNLFNINQAKKRINEAKAAGQAPAQEDLDLVATEKKRAYAVAQYTEVMSIERFARHIASHGCVPSRTAQAAILKAVKAGQDLADTPDTMPEAPATGSDDQGVGSGTPSFD